MTNEQRIINRQFYRYKWSKRELENHTLYAVAYDSSAPDGERIKTSVGNRQEQLVIRAIYETEQLRAWVAVFEKTQERFKWELKDKLMQKRFIERKKPWKICDEIGISRRTYDYWLEDILNVAYRWAKEYKLI